MKKPACLLAALLLAGCAHPPAQLQDPGLVLPSEWRTPIGPEAQLAHDWWRAFGDPVLTHWVELALAQNYDIATAAARVAEARGTEQVARAALFPTLDFSLSNSRGRTLNAFGQPSTTSTITPVFQAAYEVDLFGRIREQVSAASASTEATIVGREAAALAVAAATASGYITLRALDAKLRILQDTVEQRGQAVRLARGRAEVGYTSDLEWKQAQAEYESIAQQVPPAELAIERQEHALAVLTGQAPADIARGLQVTELKPPAIPDGLPSDLLRRRPDIVQAEWTLAAADANLAVSRAQFLPTLRLTGTFGDVLVSSLNYNPIRIWSLGESVLAPIFEGGRLEGQFAGADARRLQAVLAYQRTVLTALREVEDSLSTVTRAREQRVRVQAQRTVLTDVVRHARNRYVAGYASFLDLLDAQRNVLNADLAEVQTVADELNGLVALSQAMGGGWESTPPQK